MANMVEVKADLFKSILINKDTSMILHCISADYALGAGIALEIEKRYEIREKLKRIGTYNYPDCLVVDKVISMVTKGSYWSKPSYDTFNRSLEMVRNYCISNGIDILIMPRIGCGLDKLDWKVCKESIQSILVESGVNCSIYRLK